MNEKAGRGIVATASITNKAENQDAHSEFEGFWPAIFVADGIGSFTYPRQSAECVVQRCKVFGEGLQAPLGNDDLRTLFKQATEDLKELKVQLGRQDVEDQDLFGTTCIAAFEDEEEIVIAYIGNGAIWHIRGGFHVFDEPHPFPWTAVNLLNPHTVPENGKEALQRYLTSDDDSSKSDPSIVRITKDRQQGDIVMICTDGIHSADQVRIGRNEKGLWLRYEERMVAFYKDLALLLRSGAKEATKDDLQVMLKGYLERMKAEFDDDATLGVLVTERALYCK